MAPTDQLRGSVSLDDQCRTNWAWLLSIAAGVTLLHMLTNGRYGFHRDELQFLSDARHLDWGFVAYPPFTPFVEQIGLEIFGLPWFGCDSFRCWRRLRLSSSPASWPKNSAEGGLPRLRRL